MQLTPFLFFFFFSFSSLSMETHATRYGRGVPPEFLRLACSCCVLHSADRPSFAQVLAKLRLVELRLPDYLAQLPLDRGLDTLSEADEGQSEVRFICRFLHHF
jgi:hypothetical protein